MVKITVKVNVANKELIIKVGDGRQNFKWLAQTLQSRIKEFNILRDEYQDEGIIITCLKNIKGELINPIDCIYEHVNIDNENDIIILNINAEIATKYEADQWGFPIINDWQSNAYVRTQHGITWNNEMTAFRDNFQNGNNSNEYQSAAYSNLVQIGEALSESELSMAYELDWNQMKFTWLEDILTEGQRVLLHDVLQNHYYILYNLFLQYCGIAKVGQRYGLSLIDFRHILHIARIYNVLDNPEKVDAIFFKISGESLNSNESSNTLIPSGSKSSLNARTVSDNWILMSRQEFAQALVYIAIEKKGDDQSISEGVDTFFNGPLLELLKFFKTSYAIYKDNDSADIQEMIKSTHHLVKIVYMSWATFHPVRGAYLMLDDLIKLFIAAGVIIPDQQAILMNKYLETQANPTLPWELQEVTFCEFIEIASKLAVHTMANESALTNPKRIRLTLHQISEVQSIMHK